MRGDSVNTNGDFSYRETIYDANKGDAIVMDAKFNCQTISNTVSPVDKPECAIAKTMVFPTPDLAKVARLSCEGRSTNQPQLVPHSPLFLPPVPPDEKQTQPTTPTLSTGSSLATADGLHPWSWDQLPSAAFTCLNANVYEHQSEIKMYVDPPSRTLTLGTMTYILTNYGYNLAPRTPESMNRYGEYGQPNWTIMWMSGGGTLTYNVDAWILHFDGGQTWRCQQFHL